MGEGGENHRGGTDGVVAFALVMGALLLGVAWGYGRFRAEINGLFLELHRALLLPFGWSGEAAEVRRLLGRQAPGDLAWGHIWAQMGYVGGWWRWVVPVPLLLGALLLYRRSRNFSRLFRMKTLLQHNVQVFPALAPVAWRNLDQEPIDRGPWRVAMTPIEFACLNGALIDRDGDPLSCGQVLVTAAEDSNRAGLVRDNSRGQPQRDGWQLDRLRCEEVFAAQLGRPFRGVGELKDHEAGLAAAFMLLGVGERARGWALLDHLSLTFREGGPPRPQGERRGAAALRSWLGRRPRGSAPEAAAGQAPSVSIRFTYRDDQGRQEPLDAREVAARLSIHPAVEAAVRCHTAWSCTWLSALLRFARRKGVVAPAEFVWVRPADRTLWYSLHQISEAVPTGGAGVDRGLAAWVEAAGVWSHMSMEGLVGAPLTDPQVGTAADALESALRDEGWID